MAISRVQSNSGAQNSGLATVTATWASPATAGNLLVLIVGSDDYAASPPSGWTQSTGCKQETFLGHYVWWKVAAGGETSVNYTIGSAATSAWITAEYLGVHSSPYDTSNGQLAASSANTYTTAAVTPGSGDRLLIASMGGSLGAAGLTTTSAWLNSFTAVRDSATVLGSGTRDLVGYAERIVTADGATGYSSGCTYNISAESRTGILIAMKAAPAAAPGVPYQVSQYGSFH